MLNWFKKQIIAVSFAMRSVEKNAFSQRGENLENDTQQEQKHSQGTLMDTLLNGVITKETRNLAWRTYKVLQASDHIITTVIGYDENNMPITQTKKKNRFRNLEKIKIDDFDSYELEMVINNDEITLGGAEAVSISGNTWFSTHNNKKPIEIKRSSIPKFEIEQYATKLNVRNIKDDKKLLEFYVSMYPDEYNRNSRLLISEIKKAIQNPRTSSLLDIKEVKFITYKAIGVDNFLEFKYTIESFDKIIEFNGSYVIKFIAEAIIDGESILEKHRVEELDEKYNNKESKNNTYEFTYKVPNKE